MNFLVRTKKEADLLITEIDLLLQSFFHVKDGFDKTLKSNIRIETATEIKRFIQEKSLKPNEIKKYLEDLKSKLKNYEILTLTLAIAPSEKIVESISTWARKNIQENILLELLYEHSIIAGATIIFKGRYKDHSFKKPLEEFFKNYRNMSF